MSAVPQRMMMSSVFDGEAILVKFQQYSYLNKAQK